MDFLSKLDILMEQHGLNKNTLSKACDIPYTTIDNWYKRGYDGLKLTTLRKLSAYFDISLDYWARDDVPPKAFYSKDEVELVRCYRNHPELQSAVRKLLDMNTFEQN